MEMYPHGQTWHLHVSTEPTETFTNLSNEHRHQVMAGILHTPKIANQQPQSGVPTTAKHPHGAHGDVDPVNTLYVSKEQRQHFGTFRRGEGEGKYVSSLAFVYLTHLSSINILSF